MDKIIIYTDGACSKNPGPGGWGAVLIYNETQKEISGYHPQTTNNIMELSAAIEALKALKKECQIDLYSDSKYVIDGISSWIFGWEKKGWVTAGRQPVKNKELWQELLALSRQHQVKWHWVKGHSDNLFNERCDQLARAEIEKNR